MNDLIARNLTATGHFFRYWMPYQFVKLASTRHKHLYLPLNRDYKPLGCTSREHVRYEDFEAQAVNFPSDPHKIKNVWSNPETLHLYKDGPVSRKDYFARLEELMSRSLPLAEFKKPKTKRR